MESAPFHQVYQTHDGVLMEEVWVFFVMHVHPGGQILLYGHNIEHLPVSPKDF